MPHHTLTAAPETIHWGHLDAALPPKLTVKSGDTVTITSVSGPREFTPGPERLLPEHVRVQNESVPEVGPHILTGPVAVEGAEPGDLLEVRIKDISLPCDWGWILVKPLLGTLPEDFPFTRNIIVELDRASGIAKLPFGPTVPLAPFFGIISVAPPPAYGRVSTIEPREYGGNIDLKELTVGTTIFLPVFNDGALFSVGDGHAAQGDGEVCLCAIETCLDGTFELIVHKKSHVRFPRVETETAWITLGLNEDLDDAAKQALREMIVLIGELRGLSAIDAYMLCSVAADMRITQLVDGNKGVHCVLPKSILA